MWNYEKRLQFPVKITQTNPKIAQVIISSMEDRTENSRPPCATLPSVIRCRITQWQVY